MNIATLEDFVVGTERAWVAGFDDAVYDSTFNSTRDQDAFPRIGLFVCGQEYSGILPPYCNTSVEAASLNFERGLGDLQRYLDGYQSASSAMHGPEVKEPSLMRRLMNKTGLRSAHE